MKHETTLMEQVEVLRAACCIAAADGDISNAELKLIHRLAHIAGVGKASREAMIDQALNNPDFLESQFRFLMNDPNRAMKILFFVASADGEVGHEEELLMKDFAKRIQLDETRLQQLLKRASDDNDQPTLDGEN
jgi:tellurite resistance protein